MKTYISAIDYFLPDEIVNTTDMLAETKPARFNIKDDFILKLIGIKQVRHAPSSMLPSQLAILASERMFAKTSINRQNIDAIIFCGIDRDCMEPSTAHYVQHGLGIDHAECKDVSNACLGFMTGLKDASLMIRCGEAKHVLVCTGERPSDLKLRVIKALVNENRESVFRNKLGALTVGDAGASAIVSISEDNSGFKGMNFISNGALANLCYYKYSKFGQPQGQMLMKEISDEILEAHQTLFPKTKKKLNFVSEDIDCLITHQVGKRPWTRYPSIMDVKRNIMTKSFDLLGNITSATFPINYAKALEDKRIKKGDFVFAAMAGSGLTVCQVGLTV